MQSFRSFIHEGKYPVWVKLSVGSLIMKMKNLTAQIQSEPDPVKQNQLIARQNDLLSYMSGLSIAVGTTDSLVDRFELLQDLRLLCRLQLFNISMSCIEISLPIS